MADSVLPSTTRKSLMFNVITQNNGHYVVQCYSSNRFRYQSKALIQCCSVPSECIRKAELYHCQQKASVSVMTMYY